MYYLKNIWSLNEIDNKLALITRFVTWGKVLSFEINVHWDAKKALKQFAFSLKFDTCFLLIKMGDIIAFFSIIEGFHYGSV